MSVETTKSSKSGRGGDSHGKQKQHLYTLIQRRGRGHERILFFFWGRKAILPRILKPNPGRGAGGVDTRRYMPRRSSSRPPTCTTTSIEGPTAATNDAPAMAYHSPTHRGERLLAMFLRARVSCGAQCAGGVSSEGCGTLPPPSLRAHGLLPFVWRTRMKLRVDSESSGLPMKSAPRGPRAGGARRAQGQRTGRVAPVGPRSGGVAHLGRAASGSRRTAPRTPCRSPRPGPSRLRSRHRAARLASARAAGARGYSCGADEAQGGQ